MKKTAAVLAITFTILIILGLGVFASRSDFVIVDGNLVEYRGAGGNVIVPEEVTSISPGVFTSEYISSVTVLNYSCYFSEDSVAPGITLRGYPTSTAETYATSHGSGFSSISLKPTVILTINYVYQDGSTARDSYSKEYDVYSYYEVNSPEIQGYTPDQATVKGTLDDGNLTLSVTYTKKVDPIPTGWKIEGSHIRFYDSSAGGYIRSGSINMDGATRSFDENGYLIGSETTVTINGATYYLRNNTICYGSVRIGDGMYYFDSEGKMVKGQTVGTNTYDAEGRLTAASQFLVFPDFTYYLEGNKLATGFKMIGDSVYCFGDDYVMKTNVVFDQCTFDAAGHLSEVNIDQLECKYDETRTYNKQEQKPQVEVYLRGVKLTEDVHYTVEYADNKNPGEGKIIINGLGFVKGSAEFTFEIVGKETYTLTIKYQNSRGEQMHDTYTAELDPGEHYSVASPEIKGYKPDKKKVEGDISDADVTVIVTYVSEKEGGAVSSDTETSDTDNGTERETDAGDKKPGESKTRRIYSYDFKLFFTVAAIATLLVAIIIFLVIRFGKKRRNPPAAPDGGDSDDGDIEGPDGPVAGILHDEPYDEGGEETDMSDTIKFDLNEIELDDFDENKTSTDFADIYEFSLGDTADVPVVPAKPKRYHFRKK